MPPFSKNPQNNKADHRLKRGSRLRYWLSPSPTSAHII
jgi:hypothetical protein